MVRALAGIEAITTYAETDTSILVGVNVGVATSASIRALRCCVLPGFPFCVARAEGLSSMMHV